MNKRACPTFEKGEIFVGSRGELRWIKWVKSLILAPIQHPDGRITPPPHTRRISSPLVDLFRQQQRHQPVMQFQQQQHPHQQQQQQTILKIKNFFSLYMMICSLFYMYILKSSYGSRTWGHNYFDQMTEGQHNDDDNGDSVRYVCIYLCVYVCNIALHSLLFYPLICLHILHYSSRYWWDFNVFHWVGFEVSHFQIQVSHF